MRYVAVISYFGARYVGWQRQLNGSSVQETLEKALSKSLGAEVSATASGRTDAGVHALAQVVPFRRQFVFARRREHAFLRDRSRWL